MNCRPRSTFTALLFSAVAAATAGCLDNDGPELTLVRPLPSAIEPASDGRYRLTLEMQHSDGEHDPLARLLVHVDVAESHFDREVRAAGYEGETAVNLVVPGVLAGHIRVRVVAEDERGARGNELVVETELVR